MKYTIFEDSQQAIFAWFCGHMNRGACQPQVWSLLLIWRPYETLHGIYSSLKFCKNCKNSGLKCKLWVINYFFMELLYNCWILELKTKKSRSFKYHLSYSAVPNIRPCSLTIFTIIFHPARTFLACSLNECLQKIHPARLLQTAHSVISCILYSKLVLKDHARL